MLDYENLSELAVWGAGRYEGTENRLLDTSYRISVGGPQKQYETHNEHHDCYCENCEKFRLGI